MKKPLIFTLLFGLITFTAGYQLKTSNKIHEIAKPSVPQTSQCSIQCEELNKLEVISQKYLKTKEFMPQAIIALLAAIGVQFTREQREDLALKISQNPERFKEIIETNSTLNSYKSDQNAEPDVTRNSSPVTSLIRSEEKAAQSSQIKNSKIFHESSYTQNIKRLNRVSGRYQGFIKFFEGPFKGEKHTVKLEMNYFINNKKEIDGDYFLQITNTSKEHYSTNRGSGGNKNVRIHQSGITIFEASPDSYIQIPRANFNNELRIKGKYLDKSQVVGIVYLEKQ